MKKPTKAILLSVILALIIFAGMMVATTAAPAANPTLTGHIGGASYAVDYFGGVAYVGSGPRVLVFDVTTPGSPSLIDQSSPLPDVVQGVKVFNGLLYVAAGDSGLYILNPSLSGVPVLGSYNTAGIATDVALATDPNTSKPYAFIADGSNGVVAVDVTNSASPAAAIIYNYKPAGATSAEGIAAEGSNLYIAYGASGVHVFKPFKAGGAAGFSNALGLNLRDVAVRNGFIYLADSAYGLRVIYWNDGTESFGTPGSYATGLLSAGAVAVNSSGSYAYLVGSGASTGGIEIVNTINKPTLSLAGSADLPDVGFAVALDGAPTVAFVAAGPSGLRVMNVTTPSAITEAASYTSVGAARNLALSGNYGFLADGKAGLKVLDLSTPGSPQVAYQSQKQRVTDAVSFVGVAITGTHAFVADDALSGVRVFDVNSLSAPITPTEVASITLVEAANNIAVQGNYAYVANNADGMQVVDISNPLSIAVTGAYTSLNSETQDVAISGNYAFLADGQNGMQVVDISNPAAPTGVASYVNTPPLTATVSFAQGIAVYGNYAYIADSDLGVHVVDVMTPTTPTGVGFIETLGGATDVIPAGPYYILVADFTDGMRLVDVSDPTNPTEVGSYNTAGLAMGGAFDGYARIASDEGGLYTITALDTDLSISVTDGLSVTTYGAHPIYTIIVSNLGNHHAAGVNITDIFPTDLISTTWECTPNPFAECTTATGSGDINTTVNLKQGGIVFFTASGTVSTTVGAVIENTASLSTLPGIDTNSANNSATDTTATASTDLVIGKTVHAATIIPGEGITYTVTVTNTGSQSVTGATVTDSFPAGVSNPQWVCAAQSGATCPASGSGDINASVDLPSGGGKVTFTITGTVAQTATGTLTNTASVASSTAVADSNLANNTASVAVTLTPMADLQIDKIGAFGGLPGTAITYTITVTNTGPSFAAATVQDTLPAAVINATWTCTASAGASCAASGAGSINQTVNLPANGSATFVVKGTVSPSAGAGTLNNSATISVPAGVTDPVAENNSAIDSRAISTPQTDMQLSLSNSAATEIPGTAASQYLLAVVNTGPAAVSGATVTATFPSSLSGVSWTCAASTGATCPASGTGNINTTVDMPVSGQVIFTIDATVKSSATGSLSVSAGVSPPGGTTDTNSANNTATDTDTLTPQVNLSISQSHTGSNITGRPFTYTLTIDNSGPSDAPGATISDTFPTQLDGVSWTCAASGGASCAASGTGNINQSVDVPSGGQVVFTAGGTIATGSSGVMTNRADVAAPAGITDTDTANNTSTTQVTVNDTAQFDLSLDTSAPATVTSGDTFTYTFTISNSGPDLAPDVQLSDTLPTGVTFVSASAGCTYSGSVTCNIAGIAAGGQASVQVIVKVNPTASVTTLSGTASVLGNGNDTNAANNVATVNVSAHPIYVFLPIVMK